MTRFLILVALLVFGAGALFATNPNRAVFDGELEALILEQIDTVDPEAAQDEVTGLLLTTCKIGRAGCARLIRSLMEVDLQDHVLISIADVRLGESDPIRCYGLLNRVICPAL